MTSFQQTDGTTTVCSTAAFCTGNSVNGATHEREATEGGTAGSGTINLTVDANANNLNAVTFTVLDGTNNLEDLDGATGNWTFRYNVTGGRNGHLWTGAAACRVNSSCVNQETICSDQTISQDLKTTGVKSVTVNQASTITMGATDRIAVVYAFDDTSGMTVNHTASPTETIDNQWAAAAGDISASPGAGSLTLTGFAPTTVTTDDKSASPGVGALSLAGFAPTTDVSEDKAASPGVGALTLTGFAPTATATDNKTASPGVGALTLAGFAPSAAVGGDITASPGAGALALAGFAPTTSVTEDKSAQPGAGALTLTGFAPTVVVTDNKTASPGVGALSLTGFAPTAVTGADKTASPGVGALALTGFAPTTAVGADKTASPGVGALALEGFAPTVVRTDDKSASPGVGQITITGFAPTVTITADKAVSPGAGAMSLEGFAPLLTISSNIVANPGVGAVSLEGFAPTVTGGEAALTLEITDTEILQLPVDYWLAKDVPISEKWRTLEKFGGKASQKKIASASAPVRLQGDGPSFTVTTNRKGYD